MNGAARVAMRAAVLGACLVGIAWPGRSQEPPPPTVGETRPEPSPPPEPTFHELVTVTPCRGCLTTIVNSPAAVTVVRPEAIASAPDRSVPELLRSVPGVNAVRTSNRDWNVTSRQGTSTLANSQLVLVDGRSVYLDFMGVVLWDLVPVDPVDVEQIEVVRGPASAVWGANAFTGVVNVITRAPAAQEGSSLALSFTSFDREAGSTVGEGSGAAYSGAMTMSRKISESLAYRISGSYAASDPLARPVGVLPLVPHPLEPDVLVGGGELPADDQEEAGDFRNRGTTQPHVDLRIDQELESGRIVYGAGIAGTDGIVHTGVGPFNFERGTYLGHLRAAMTRGLFRAAATATLFGGKASNLLAFDVEEEPLRLRAQTRTYELEANHSRLVGTRHLVTYGGNLRYDTSSVNLAPGAENRTELGAYAQEEFYTGFGEGRRSELRVAVGLRVDKLGNLADPFFSPRVSVIWKAGPAHSFRASLNRAFRAPSTMNNYLDTEVLSPVDLNQYLSNLPPELQPLLEEDFLLTQTILGNAQLEAESITSWELGYVGTVGGRTTLGANLYVNDTSDNINFVAVPEDEDHDPYTVDDPPPGWELPPIYIGVLAAQGVYFPKVRNQFDNLGPIRHRGVELFAEHRFHEGLTGFVNYSWQPDPEPRPAEVPFPAVEITLPPRSRVNAGLVFLGTRFTGSLGMCYADRAFWVDVLPHDFDGESPAYTSFNAALGVRFARGKMSATLRGTNLTNAAVQQHAFGDIQKRALSAELRFWF